jgi:hypothetical protein
MLRRAKTGFCYSRQGALAARIIDVLAQPQRHAELGRAAADHARRGYDFRTRSLPRYRRLIQSLIG